MKPSEKLRGDLDRALAGLGATDASPDGFRALTDRYFGAFPADARQGLALSLEARWRADRASAATWAAALGSILAEDFDGAELAPADWREIRDLFSESSEELPLSLLSYAMSLVLEHKAL